MRDKATLLGESGRDILLGWFAGGPIFIPLWLIGGLLLRVLRSVAEGMGVKSDFSGPKSQDTMIFFCDAVAILIAFGIVTALRRKYPYLAWSLGAGMFLTCIVWSLFLDRLQYWRG